MNRISPVLDKLIGIEDPSELVTQLEEVISDSVSPPEAVSYTHLTLPTSVPV